MVQSQQGDTKEEVRLPAPTTGGKLARTAATARRTQRKKQATEALAWELPGQDGSVQAGRGLAT